MCFKTSLLSFSETSLFCPFLNPLLWGAMGLSLESETDTWSEVPSTRSLWVANRVLRLFLALIIVLSCFVTILREKFEKGERVTLHLPHPPNYRFRSTPQLQSPYVKDTTITPPEGVSTREGCHQRVPATNRTHTGSPYVTLDFSPWVMEDERSSDVYWGSIIGQNLRSKLPEGDPGLLVSQDSDKARIPPLKSIFAFYYQRPEVGV